MGAVGDLAADFIEIGQHGVGVGIRHGQAYTDAACGADGTQQVGALVVLVRRLAGASTAPGPLAHITVLLADASFIFTRRMPSETRSRLACAWADAPSAGPGSFF